VLCTLHLSWTTDIAYSDKLVYVDMYVLCLCHLALSSSSVTQSLHCHTLQCHQIQFTYRCCPAGYTTTLTLFFHNFYDFYL